MKGCVDSGLIIYKAFISHKYCHSFSTGAFCKNSVITCCTSVGSKSEL